ncbi:hypothetical protein MJ1HA_1168 [Metallosphaera sedula]|nr:hypothetical protein MJ1HA_1168 [Metallosphaera sedula]
MREGSRLTIRFSVALDNVGKYLKINFLKEGKIEKMLA